MKMPVMSIAFVGNAKMLFVGCSVFFLMQHTSAAKENSRVSVSTSSSVLHDAKDANVPVSDYGRIKFKNNSRGASTAIEFYDAVGKKRKEIKLGDWDYPRITENKKTLGIQKFGIHSQALVIYNEAGEKIKEHAHLRPYGAIKIANDSGFVVYGTRNSLDGFSAKGGIAFYDAGGQIKKEVVFDRLWEGFGEYFGAENHFAFLYKILAKSGGVVALRCYAKSGDMLWEYPFEPGSYIYSKEALSIISDTIHVRLLLGKKKYTWSFDKHGLIGRAEGW